MARIYLWAILFVFSFHLSAQEIYTPIDTANFVLRKEESKKYLENGKKFVEQIKSGYKGGEKSYIKERFENLQEEFNKELLKGNYLFDTRFTELINNVVTQLKLKNNNIPSSLNFYVSKDISLNAASMGDNNFFVNMGVFSYLNNEDEVAAIISHEIAHLMLNHTVKTMQTHYSINKVDAKKQTLAVKNEKSGKSEKAWDKLKQIIYGYGENKRRHEFEADSAGYLLFRNTKYNPGAYLKTMKLVALYDSVKPKGLETATYEKIFSLPAQPFKKEWLKKEDFQSYNYAYVEKISKDSVKSHPEMEERIGKLKQIFPELQKTDTTEKVTEEFDKLKKIAFLEQPAGLCALEEYGVGVYLCLLELQANEHDLYYKKWLGEFFNKIYDARKSYTLNRYLDNVNIKEQSESYQQFLNFMWNLKVNEIKNIADYYTKKGS